jgi:DNA-binding response OmpR family regulator
MARKKIICIEDDRETAALIAEELNERGFELTLAYDGQEGLAAILQTRPDLVISDICMPLMSGFEVLERLTALAPRLGHIPFVFLTALTDWDFKLKARQLGVDDYVTKPVDFDKLELIIDERLAAAGPADLRRAHDNIGALTCTPRRVRLDRRCG